MRLVFEFFRGSNDFIVQKVHLLRLMPVCVGLIMVSCLVLLVPWLQVEYSWTGLNVKLLAAFAGCILLFWIGVTLIPCKESWRRFCTLHTVPAVRQVVFADVQITIWQGVAVLRLLGYWSELCSYWLIQNRRCLWLVAYKMTLPQ
jgi:hypothetical protein